MRINDYYEIKSLGLYMYFIIQSQRRFLALECLQWCLTLSVDLGVRQAVIRPRPNYTCKNSFQRKAKLTHRARRIPAVITLTEVTINQWRDDTLSCCLSVNWNTSLNNASPLYPTGKANRPGWGGESAGGGSQEAKEPGAKKPWGEKARGRNGKVAKMP